MKLTEETIWTAITNSAKKRFDHAAFKEQFPYVEDAVLLHILIDIGSRRAADEIAARAQDEVFQSTAQRWEMEAIRQFLEGKDILFKREVYAAGLFGYLMHDGHELDDIYYEVSKFIITN